jgi:HEPN domain-containing protein
MSTVERINQHVQKLPEPFLTEVLHWETARAMYKTGRYLYVVFMCQQAVEKALKALLALQGKEIKPIHKLPMLAENAGILQEFDEETRVLFENLSGYYLNARYKETIQSLSKAIGKKKLETFWPNPRVQ